MRLDEVLDDFDFDCDCTYEVVFEGARDPSEEEYALAKQLVVAQNPRAEIASIGVYAGTGDIYLETVNGDEYVIHAGTKELAPARVDEAAIRQYKRVGQAIKKRYRCMSGPKAGKLVATPGACATRKDPRRVRHGRKVMRSKKGIIKRKTRVAKRKALSKIVAKMNKRLAGKRVR